MRRVFAALVALLVVGACTDIGDLAQNKTRPDRAAGQTGSDVSSGESPGAQLRLRPVASPRVTTFNYCGGLDVVDCAVLPLVAPAENQCPVSGENPPASLGCRPLQGDEALMVGWRVMRDVNGARTLWIHRGDAAKGLAEIFVAQDAEGAWTSVQVCTGDISADGRTDVVVEYRIAALPGKVMVEAVDLSKLPAKPPLVRPEPLEVPTGLAGQGCLTAGLVRADFDQRNLEVADRPASRAPTQ